MSMQLRPLGSGEEQEALAAHSELLRDDFDFLLDLNPEIGWDQYLQILADQAQGINLRADRVPATFLVAAVDNRIVGRVSIRHYLNEYLAGTGGGHIGYAVRPEFRRQGMATQILKHSLDIAAEVGIRRALLTCDAENVISRKVIEKNGGIYENSAVHPSDSQLKHRFWIPTIRI